MRAQEVPQMLADGMLLDPASLILLGTGLAALAGFKRKSS
jgi:hypothetical protein